MVKEYVLFKKNLEMHFVEALTFSWSEGGGARVASGAICGSFWCFLIVLFNIKRLDRNKTLAKLLFHRSVPRDAKTNLSREPRHKFQKSTTSKTQPKHNGFLKNAK